MTELDAFLLVLAILALGFWLTRDKKPDDTKGRKPDDSDYPDGGHW